MFFNMNDHGMWVRELEGHWGWMPFKFKFFFFFCLGLSHYDWLNPKEKTHHTLKVAQYKNFYPRWVVDFFSKSCFVLITFLNLISKCDNFWELSLKIWQNLQKYPKTTIVAFACDLFFSFVATLQKFTQEKSLSTTTLPNSQVPNFTFDTTKNALMRQGTNLSFHNFWTNRAKVIQFKVDFCL